MLKPRFRGDFVVVTTDADAHESDEARRPATRDFKNEINTHGEADDEEGLGKSKMDYCVMDGFDVRGRVVGNPRFS